MSGHPKSPGFERGGYWVNCDRCGFNFRNTECRMEWTGLFVCIENCWEARHPQEFVRGRTDRIAPRGPIRPEPAISYARTDVSDNVFAEFRNNTMEDAGGARGMGGKAIGYEGQEQIRYPDLSIGTPWTVTAAANGTWDIAETVPGKIKLTDSSGSGNSTLTYGGAFTGTPERVLHIFRNDGLKFKVYIVISQISITSGTVDVQATGGNTIRSFGSSDVVGEYEIDFTYAQSTSNSTLRIRSTSLDGSITFDHISIKRVYDHDPNRITE